MWEDYSRNSSENNKFRKEGNNVSVATSKDKYLTFIDDYSTANKTYIGKAVVGSAEDSVVWLITCLDETGDYLKIKFADGKSTFVNKWSLRTSYNYS